MEYWRYKAFNSFSYRDSRALKKKAHGSINLNLLGGQQKVIVDDDSKMTFSISAKVRKTMQTAS